MVKNKKGFTLAEVLIAVGIISVIATFAFSISRRGLERAYDLYAYTGYKGLTDAILSGLSEEVVFDGQAQDVTFLRQVLNGTADPNNPNNPNIFTTPNKIKYTVTHNRNNNNESIYYFQMDLPTAQRVVGLQPRTSCLAYFPERNYGILLPFNQHPDVCKSTLDLSRRMDLLPFYIDNGEVGRTFYDQTTQEYEYKPIENFYSAQDAVCRVFTGNISSFNNTVLYPCDINQEEQGVVRAINPRKIRAL